MNKILKIGLITYFINFIILIVLILLSRQIPSIIMYVFWGSLIVTLASALINIRKKKFI